jgi:hypothetical protein
MKAFGRGLPEKGTRVAKIMISRLSENRLGGLVQILLLWRKLCMLG